MLGPDTNAAMEHRVPPIEEEAEIQRDDRVFAVRYSIVCRNIKTVVTRAELLERLLPTPLPRAEKRAVAMEAQSSESGPTRCPNPASSSSPSFSVNERSSSTEGRSSSSKGRSTSPSQAENAEENLSPASAPASGSVRGPVKRAKPGPLELTRSSSEPPRKLLRGVPVAAGPPGIAHQGKLQQLGAGENQIWCMLRDSVASASADWQQVLQHIPAGVPFPETAHVAVDKWCEQLAAATADAVATVCASLADVIMVNGPSDRPAVDSIGHCATPTAAQSPLQPDHGPYMDVLREAMLTQQPQALPVLANALASLHGASMRNTPASGRAGSAKADTTKQKRQPLILIMAGAPGSGKSSAATLFAQAQGGAVGLTRRRSPGDGAYRYQ